jgi:protein gp37
MVFVNSMSDLFHEDVPYEFILRIYRIMQHTEHQYQILTKRSQRLHELGKLLPLLPNVCLGVTVESAAYVHRIDHLRATPAAIRFLSLEPLLSPIHNIDLSGIDWVIVGGESGPGARPVEREWIIDIRDRCLDAGVPFFFKQWGGVQKKKAGRQLDGRIWDEMPENLKRLELSYA